jgi:hypothetical protein
MTTTMSTQQGGTDHSGSVTLLRPDGTPYPGSPFTGGGMPGPWAVVGGWQRQRLDIQLRRSEQSHRAVEPIMVITGVTRA